MSRVTIIKPEYVDRIPKVLSDGIIYISEKYSTAAHNCCCGCGVKIITPLKPGRWRLVKSGDAISVYPSIGNWSSVCQSHYWIRSSRIEWERSYTRSEIAANRASDKRVLEAAHAQRRAIEMGFWARLWKTVKGWF